MDKYEIHHIGHQTFANGIWVSVFDVTEYILTDEGWSPNQYYVSVDNSTLKVWLDNPLTCPNARPEEVFELSKYYIDAIITEFPEYAYVDYDDPLLFFYETPDLVDDRNIIFLTCWYRWKYDVHRAGIC